MSALATEVTLDRQPESASPLRATCTTPGLDGAAQIQRVYFVRQYDFVHGRCPQAAPVVLVDAALAHRYAVVLELDVVDSPTSVFPYWATIEAEPVFAIDTREVVFYQTARLAMVVRDRRHQPTSTGRGETAS
jgi:hypothetical protein